MEFQLIFLYFSSLISVARISKTMLNKSGESRHPCHVPDLRENAFKFSAVRMIFPMDFSFMACIKLY